MEKFLIRLVQSTFFKHRIHVPGPGTCVLCLKKQKVVQSTLRNIDTPLIGAPKYCCHIVLILIHTERMLHPYPLHITKIIEDASPSQKESIDI